MRGPNRKFLNGFKSANYHVRAAIVKARFLNWPTRETYDAKRPFAMANVKMKCRFEADLGEEYKIA